MKFTKDLDSYIKRTVELGYLKEIGHKDNETKYQIHRIIKEKITLDVLEEFRTKLRNYSEVLKPQRDAEDAEETTEYTENAEGE